METEARSRNLPTASLLGTTSADRERRQTLRIAGTHLLLLVAFAVSIITFIAAPVLAINWSTKPFLGFFVEQTLVISGMSRTDWEGSLHNVAHPMRVIRIEGASINTPAEFEAALEKYSPGRWLQIETQLPNGARRTFPPLEVEHFQPRDLARYFWLSYAIGLAYLLIGLWIYRLRGQTVSARAFAYFCICAAIVNGLLFDLSTTHKGTDLWVLAISQQGGAFISLAMLFPEEWAPLRRRPWLRFLPYIVSAILVVWSLVVVRDYASPWAYIKSWQFGYYYTFAGIIIFLAMMVYRLRTQLPLVQRQQVRLILLGAFFAFTPLAIWFGAIMLGRSMSWDPVVYSPLLLIFPISIAFAILRYRLWDVDVIINRTLIYGSLTVVLALIYLLGVTLFEEVFQRFTGDTSRMAAAASTLAVAALFNPARRRIQDFIDRLFYRQKYNAEKTLAAFGAKLRDEVNLETLIERLEEVIQTTIHPTHTTTWLVTPGGYQLYMNAKTEPLERDSELLPAYPGVPLTDPITTYFKSMPEAIKLESLGLESPALEEMKAGSMKISIPLVSQGELIGWLNLGPRKSEQDYSADDLTLLSNLADKAAPAVRVAMLVNQQQIEARKRDRLDYELRVARTIQYSLLPAELPDLPGWQVASYYQPASAVGGDFYDFMYFEDGRLGLVIGDVADKGIPAALVMATTRSLLRAVAQANVSPGQVLARVNNLLVPDMPSGMFVTCLYAVLDPHSGHFHYANAGHNPPYRQINASAEPLRARGMPLGLMPDMEYEEKETSFSLDESILLYSDGLVEAHNPEEDMYGYQRLQTWLKTNEDGVQTLVDCLLADLAAFTGPGWEQEDDVTLVALKRSDKVKPG